MSRVHAANAVSPGDAVGAADATPAADPLALGPAEVHVWLVSTREPLPQGWSAHGLAMLPPDEQARHARFRQPSDRVNFLMTRLLLRASLSRYEAVDPAAWRFERNPLGRPVMARGSDPSHSLRFNVSHTEGLVAVAVCRHADVGVDVETCHRGWLARADVRVFAPGERAALDALEPPARQVQAHRLWTLKEAYAKARGLGLHMAFDEAEFHGAPGGAVRLSTPAHLDPQPARWRCWTLDPTPSHVGAVAVDTGQMPGATLSVCRVRPLPHPPIRFCVE